MARRSKTANPESLRLKLVELLSNLPERLRTGSVGEQVGELVQVHHSLRDLGASIGASLAPQDSDSGRARVIAYLRNQVGRIVHTDELMIVAGIGDYARRIRELRAHHGWPIISGMAVHDMRAAATSRFDADAQLSSMVPEEYLLIEDRRDPDAIRRWADAPRIRDESNGAKEAILAYLQMAAGKRVTAEELRYVSGNDVSWPFAVRALREEGWAIAAHAFGSAALPPGLYVLEPSEA